MIKLIACDLDGTLLQNNSQSLNPRIFPIIKKLNDNGILFVAASGRQYPNLYRLFEPASKDMAFICENGSLIKYKDTMIQKTLMDRVLGFQLIQDISNREGCEVLISGENTSYIKPKTDSYLRRMRDVVKNNVTVLENFSDIKENFIKISVYEASGIKEGNGPSLLDKWNSIFKCTVSGHGWLDFVSPHVNKGYALEALLDRFNILPEEVMVFGDNYNDIEMLSLATYGYVMENAHDEIKEKYQYRSKLVEDTLEEYIRQHIDASFQTDY